MQSTNPPSLEALVGHEVGIMLPRFNSETTTRATILRVESAGLWLVIPDWTEAALKRAGQTIAPRTIALFVPYQQIGFVVGSYEVPSVSERVLL